MAATRPGCPGLTACRLRRATCGHADRVETYRDARQAWEQLLEASNPGMYETEVSEWIRDHPGLTFREYLRQTRRTV